jgi:hypothetical protein
MMTGEASDYELNGTRMAEDVSPVAKAVYRVLVGELLSSGTVADQKTLAWQSSLGIDEIPDALAELSRADWIGRITGGEVVAIYPFSPAPTPIVVQIDGLERYAMCAVDALGVAPMLGQPVQIRTACPVCDAPIQIAVRPDRIALRHPPSTIVIRRRSTGPAHLNRCSATRFACSPEHAQAWIDANGGPDDVLRSLEASFREAIALFGNRAIG